MALDGMLLHFISREISDAALDSRVDKVHQPDRDTILLALRGRNGNRRLLISVSSANARIHLTGSAMENPAAPPMFCMLLRKHLTGGRLVAVRQPGLERCMQLVFECRNELGDLVPRTLVAEIMGKHSNLILLDEADRILGCVKHIDFSDSALRQVMPGLPYQLPPAQDKLDPFLTAPDTMADAVVAQGDLPLDKAILRRVHGLSPIVCREIAHRTTRGQAECAADALDADGRARLAFFLGELRTLEPVPVLVCEPEDARPFDFTFLEVTQYGTAAVTRRMESFSALVETAFLERARADLRRRRQQDLLRILSNAAERISRKLAAQRTELAACADREALREQGDLLNANLYRLEKGMPFCELEDFYHDNAPVRIPLDPTLTPAQNAQRYYKRYRKADHAEKILTAQIAAGEAELTYIDSVFDELSRADTAAELAEIRAELQEAGYVRLRPTDKRPKTQQQPQRFRASDGTVILCGRNNAQNDLLTLRLAHNNHLWLHTKNIPGSHTVICADAANISEQTLREAAGLAALLSKAADSSQVPVDYTLVKYVKKPSGAKPGMVIYTNQKTLYVTPDKALAERLKED